MSPTLNEQAADLLGITLTKAQETAFTMFARELVTWNEQVNLTAITDDDGIRVRHFLDSLTITKAEPMRAGLKIIDVGTGAGFPGLPLKIAYPEVEVTLLEATGKKIAFLDHVIAALGLTGVHTLHARAEEAGHMAGQRGAYDVVVARAVARLPVLLEYLLPLAKVGGRCIAMKGAKTAYDEARDSAKSMQVLGARLGEIVEVRLPEVEEIHALVVVEKTAPTPSAYPRKPGIPTKKPLI